MTKGAAIIAGLAWRNVWRNRRRSVLTLVTVVMSAAMIFFMNGLQKGGQDQMIEDAASMNTGHLQIHEKDFWENQAIEYAFIPPAPLVERLEALRREKVISGWTRRVHAGCLFAYGRTSSGGSIQAIDPAREPAVTALANRIMKGGRHLRPGDDRHIVMGRDLARSLGVSVGDRVDVLSQGFDGSIAAARLTVVGIFLTGTPELDRYLACMPLDRAQQTFTMMGHVNAIALRLASIDDLPRVRRVLRGLPGTASLEIMGCDELMPELMQHLEMDRIPAMLFNFILLFVAAFGILNTIQMAVFERTREFGVMLALGTRPGQVRAMVLWETAFIALLGVLLGVALGALACGWFIMHPIDYSGLGDEVTVYGVPASFSYSPRITALNCVVTPLALFAAALVFSIVPAWRASRLRPIEAIRQL